MSSSAADDLAFLGAAAFLSVLVSLVTFFSVSTFSLASSLAFLAGAAVFLVAPAVVFFGAFGAASFLTPALAAGLAGFALVVFGLVVFGLSPAAFLVASFLARASLAFSLAFSFSLKSLLRRMVLECPGRG